MPVHVVGLCNGAVWHTIRTTNGEWDPWTLVGVTDGLRIGCAVVDGQLHVCVAGGMPKLQHSIRFSRSNWQPWGDAAAAGFPQIQDLDGVDCASIGKALNVCVTGNTRSEHDSGVPLPAVWLSMRTANAWTAPRELSSRYSAFLDHTGGSVGDALHIVAQCVQAGSFTLIHTVRMANGAMQPLGDQDLIKLFPAEADSLSRITTVAAAGVQGQLHVVASNGKELFHTIRLNEQLWQNTFGSVRQAADPTSTGPLAVPACASADGNLHVFALSEGSIVHTIRVTSRSKWCNPETALTGKFGDVIGAVPASAGGLILTRQFTDIAAAGD